MALYYYKAKKGPKEIIEETINAENEQVVLQEISRRGYFPVSIEMVKKGRARQENVLSWARRIRVGELAMFSRQLSDLLGAGLPLFRAINILSEQTGVPLLKRVLESIREDIKEGLSLSASIRKNKKIFPPIFGNMIHAGEVGGFLEQVLDNLASFLEKDNEVREKVRSAMLYPILVAVLGGGAVVFMMIYVVPMMVSMFEDTGQSLPVITRMLISVSDFLRDYWWAGIGAIVLAVVVSKRVAKTKEGKIRQDRFKLSIPVIGELIGKTEVSRFTRTLSALLTNGVPMLQALDVVGENISNTVIKSEIVKASEEIKRGGSLGSVLKRSKYFPALVTNMVVIGEESGQVEAALGKVAVAYDREIDSALKKFTTLLEPVMILLVAGVVLFIVIAMMLPIFQMNAMVG